MTTNHVPSLEEIIRNGCMRLKVLIACEFSGTVRDAFTALGHNATSCDLLPSETPGKHIQGDALKCLNDGWDLLIAHPPCTYLANSGVRWLYGGKGTVRDESRWALLNESIAFFKALLNCSIPRICIENPIPHRYAIAGIGHSYSQTIQPWQFGHPETKATCLWLRGLPKLTPTNIVSGRTPRVHFASPGPDRWRERSRTLTGIAQAMAQQWSTL